MRMRSLTRDTKSFLSISGLCPSGLYLGEAGEAEAEVKAEVKADVEGDVDVEDEVRVMIWVVANTEYCSSKKIPKGNRGGPTAPGSVTPEWPS